MFRIAPPVGLFRLAVLGLVGLAAGCTLNSGKDAADPDKEGLRADTGDDGTVTVTVTSWNGKTKGFAWLKSHAKAATVRLTCPEVDDEVVAALEGFDNLRDLDLSTTRVTDAGLTPLKELPKLEKLRLAKTGVTDKCFEAIDDLKSLTFLDVSDTKVTAEAAAKWKDARPGRTVQR